MVSVSSADDTVDGIIIRVGTLQSLEHNRANTVGTTVSNGAVIEGVAAPRTRKEVAPVKASVVVWVGLDSDTSCHGRVTVVSSERVACHINGCKAGGASSVNTDARPAELEVIVDAARGEGTVTTRNEVSVNVLSAVDFTVIVASHSIEDTDSVSPRGRSAVRNETGHFEGFVGSEESKPLGQVRLEGLAGRHVEEARIENPGLLDPAAVLDLTRVSCFPLHVDVCLYIPSVRWDLAMNIETFVHDVPKSLCIVRLREASRETDDGYLCLLGPSTPVAPFCVLPGIANCTVGLEVRNSGVL